jgi:hypothetical protein
MRLNRERALVGVVPASLWSLFAMVSLVSAATVGTPAPTSSATPIATPIATPRAPLAPAPAGPPYRQPVNSQKIYWSTPHTGGFFGGGGGGGAGGGF